MAQSADSLIGTVIDGRFEIRDKVGQGGMGTVYRAWQRSVGREVAIKLIDRSISNDPMSTRRFLREAHLASQLSHPNTISVFDFGQMPDGRLFTAMELLRGRTLGRELRMAGAFPLARIVRIGTQLCDALEAAHAQRIVHRDLKLDNVMLLDAGNDHIKVLDFGLAKTLDDKSTQATAAGIVVGTPRYIAPETAMTGEATPASDMYAVGVMLGELALAAPLWEGTSLSAILQFQLQPQPIVQTVPRPLRDIVARLLAPRPQGRPSAAETRKLLQLVGEGKPLPPSPEQRATLASKKSSRDREPTREPQTASTPRDSRRRLLLLGGAIVLPVAVVVAYVAMRKPNTELAPAPAVVAPAPAVVAPTIDAAAVTNRDPALVDPWTDDYQRPIDTANIDAALPQPVTIRVVGMPKGFLLEVNGRRIKGGTFAVDGGARVLLEVWNPDHSILFRQRSFKAIRDADIDVGVHELSECVSTDPLCRQVYCQPHRDDRACLRNDDTMNPFE
jgi:serine/threonine-protein kinase